MTRGAYHLHSQTPLGGNLVHKHKTVKFYVVVE